MLELWVGRQVEGPTLRVCRAHTELAGIAHTSAVGLAEGKPEEQLCDFGNRKNRRFFFFFFFLE